MTAKSEKEYGAIAKSFHWAMALLILGMIGAGLYMTRMEIGLAKLQTYNLHKSVGISILALAVCRILWRLTQGAPDYVASLKRWERLAATAMHGLLYAAMLGMPISGWLMSSAYGRPVSFFGLFTLPDLIGQDIETAKVLAWLHGLAAYALLFCIAVHAAAALKHHFIDRDATLSRMLPRFKRTGNE